MDEPGELPGDPEEMIEGDPDDGDPEGGEEPVIDDDTDKRQYGIYQALPVDDSEPDWASGEAATVEEYLRRVRCAPLLQGHSFLCSIHCPITDSAPFPTGTRLGSCRRW